MHSVQLPRSSRLPKGTPAPAPGTLPPAVSATLPPQGPRVSGMTRATPFRAWPFSRGTVLRVGPRRSWCGFLSHGWVTHVDGCVRPGSHPPMGAGCPPATRVLAPEGRAAGSVGITRLSETLRSPLLGTAPAAGSWGRRDCAWRPRLSTGPCTPSPVAAPLTPCWPCGAHRSTPSAGSRSLLSARWGPPRSRPQFLDTSGVEGAAPCSLATCASAQITALFLNRVF